MCWCLLLEHCYHLQSDATYGKKHYKIFDNQHYPSSGRRTLIKKVKIMLFSRPPSKRAKKDGSGEPTTTFLYLCRISEAQSDWLIALICTGFPHHPLIIRTFSDLLTTPPIYWSQASNFKNLAFSRLHTKIFYAIAIPLLHVCPPNHPVFCVQSQ